MSLLTAQDFRALGTGCRIVTDSDVLEEAFEVAMIEIAAIDLACSRFRSDSELMRVNERAGHWVSVSPLFLEALEVALVAARRTDGAVDPTIGSVMRALGYDNDFAAIAGRQNFVVRVTTVPGWQTVEVDSVNQRVRVVPGTSLDFGATAKALAADKAAAAVFTLTGAPVLISLGGDIAVAGPAPEGGWIIDIGDSHTGGEIQQTVSISSGGLATSSTSVRRWTAGNQQMHHIMDPSSAAPVTSQWRTVSVSAASCVDANVATTAAIIKGNEAPLWLILNGAVARLVDQNGMVTTVNDWPPS